MLKNRFKKLILLTLLPTLLLGDGQINYQKIKEKLKAQVTKDNVISFGLMFICFLLFSNNVKSEIKTQNEFWNDYAKASKQEEKERHQQEKEKEERTRKEKMEQELRDKEWKNRWKQAEEREAERLRKEKEADEAWKRYAKRGNYYWEDEANNKKSNAGSYRRGYPYNSNSSYRYGFWSSGSSTYGAGAGGGGSWYEDEQQKKMKEDIDLSKKIKAGELISQAYEENVYTTLFSNGDYITLVKKSRLNKSCSAFDLLGLPLGSYNASGLEKRRRALQRIFHPDKHVSDSLLYQSITKLINEAADACLSKVST